MKISAVLIAFNEADRIKRTLDSLDWCDEIVVVDSGSSDATMEICRQSGCKVFSHSFTTFGEQKKFAFSLAENEWIFSIDADEVVSPKLKKEFLKLKNSPPGDIFGYTMIVRLVFLGKDFRFGKESRHKYMRLFHRDHMEIVNPEIHEKILISGKTAHLNAHMLHDSYRSMDHYLEKFNLYTTNAAAGISSKNRRISPWKIYPRFPFSFIKYYLWDLNFLNGFAGITWAWLNSFYVMVKYLKAYEMQKRSVKWK